MENTIKILEIFSRNWVYIFSLFVLVPCLKLAISSIVQMRIAKLTNKNSVIFHLENKDFKKTLEISTNDLNLAELKTQIDQIESQNLIAVCRDKNNLLEDNFSEKKKVS